MARLIVKSAELEPLVIELKKGRNSFGRSDENDYLLDDSAISEQHCEVVVEDENILVRDLGSTNGTFIDGRQVKEEALKSGQTLQLGDLELVLDTEPTLSIPDLPQVTDPHVFEVVKLDDGFAACMDHATRHAVWECTNCTRVYCDECIKKLRRVGGLQLKLCPACSNPCKLSAWSEMLKRKKKSLLGAIADKVKSNFKRTRALINGDVDPTLDKKKNSKLK